jgi:tetratricopeptide (TPR) repeat protein
VVLSTTLANTALGQTLLPGIARFVDIIELTDHDDQADIAIQFNCSLRYVTHLPQSEGTELRIELRPLPDCGVNPSAQIAGELPPISGGDKIISAARVESDIPGQITLVLSFSKSERFVIAQGADLRGTRVRLIDRARGRGKVILSEPMDAVSNFAINLESQLKPIDGAELELASQRLKLPVYVSETTVEEQKWYRLRAGPIERRSDANRVLNQALPYYPRAWLAIGDDASTIDTTAAAQQPATTVERIGSDPALDPARLRQMVGDARAALAKADFAQSIRILTKLQRQPEFAERADMQELLGLTYERAGQLAQAKAEYQEYLRRYPQGAAAERIRERLRVLRTAAANNRDLGLGAAAAPAWMVTGGIGQLFRYDGTSVASNVTGNGATASTGGTQTNSAQATSQDALYTDIDLLARRRGERYGVVARFSGGYARDFSGGSALGRASPNITRISVASLDLADANLGLLARVGRQTRNEGGVLGTFDGALLSYQWRPAWNLNATVGYPVEQSDQGISSQRRFEAVSLAYTPPGSHWDASVFYTQQQFDGFRDRQAVGLDARYLIARLSLAAIVDYDIFYHSLNAASVLGTLQLPARWNLSLDLEHRNAPVLTTGNALIGQPDTRLTQLEQVFTKPEIYQWARDRTPTSSNYALTATRPLGERYQFAATVIADRIGPTVASGGVAATPGTGLETTYQVQLYASSFWTRGDFNVLSVSHARTEIGLVDDLGLTSRFPLAGAWRLGPRLNVERRVISTDNSRELDFLPSFLLDYQRRRVLLQCELGGEIGSRDAALQNQNTHRYYVSLAYRYSF